MQTPVTPEQRQAARREIVRQVEQGATASVARGCCAVPMHRTTVYRLLKRVQSEGESAVADRRHGYPTKLRGEVLTFLREQCHKNPCISGPAVQRAMDEYFGHAPSVSQLNRVRASLGLSRKPVSRGKKAQHKPLNKARIPRTGRWFAAPGCGHRDRPAHPIRAVPAISRSPTGPTSTNRLNCPNSDRSPGSPAPGRECGSPPTPTADCALSQRSWLTTHVGSARLYCRRLGAAHWTNASLRLSVYRSLFIADRPCR